MNELLMHLFLLHWEYDDAFSDKYRMYYNHPDGHSWISFNTRILNRACQGSFGSPNTITTDDLTYEDLIKKLKNSHNE